MSTIRVENVDNKVCLFVCFFFACLVLLPREQQTQCTALHLYNRESLTCFCFSFWFPFLCRDSSDEEEYQKRKFEKQSNQSNANTCNTELVVVNIEDTMTCNNPQYEGASGGYDVEVEEELPRPGSATTYDAVNFGYIDDDTTELVPDNTSEKDYTPLYAEVEYGWGADHPNADDDDEEDYDLNLWDDDESWDGEEYYTYGVDEDVDDDDDDDDDDLDLDYNYDTDDSDSDDDYDVRYSHEANWRQGQYRTFAVVTEGGGGNSTDPDEEHSFSHTYKKL